ncbi:hypothetical protein HPB47_010626 [Ixodes persulcatus]|uniref:Uncharacterized protein n=1 Tax=Ixodes persulcatus TaxID=34615 RepID=A0AC60NYM4_IXOPE|nr:hypothetical protein HPB47_010626 [Ixodes persulcatus]
MNLPPKKKCTTTSANNVTVLDSVSLPGAVRMALEKGTKYSYEPSSEQHELLGMVRRVANHVSMQDRERAISERVDSLKHTVSREPRKQPVRKIVDFMRDSGLTVVQADKEGGFVVMREDLFQGKALVAIENNLKPVKHLPKKQKTAALRLLKDVNLEEVRRKAVNKTENCLAGPGQQVRRASPKCISH